MSIFIREHESSNEVPVNKKLLVVSSFSRTGKQTLQDLRIEQLADFLKVEAQF
jgi:hypothetical protein